jgi:TonB family protein
MSSALIWNNLLIYSLQIGLLVGLAAFVPEMLRLRLPGARLIYLQVLLAACLLLPVVQPWKHAVAGANLEVSTTVVVVERREAPGRPSVPWRRLGLGLLAAGMLTRLGLLAVGLRRLDRYRRNARRLARPGSCPTFLSDEISSPVTFGFRKPVVLLPARFPEMDPAMQQAILCHEFLHVERCDWIVTVIEEVVRAVFWFHPAIWWVLGEIQLSREQAVDRAVVERTRAREEYVDALLAIAGAQLHPDLAPAPLFLRRRHLKQRVISIFKEVQMSKTRLMSRLAVGLAILITACWLVTQSLPLAAAPQVVNDAPGVTVDTGAAALMHRAPVAYPETARRNRVQGSVVLEATLDASGNVSDARVINGPVELRRAALDSVLQWHFANGAAGAIRQVTIGFQLTDDARRVVETLRDGAPGQSIAWVSRALEGRTVKSIRVQGLSDQARSELLSSLPVHEGDTLSAELIAKAEQAVKGFDEHLRLMGVSSAPGEATLQITGPAPPPPPPPAITESQPASPSRIRIGGAVQQAKLISQPHPIYPPDAKAARIQGVVQLSAIIGKDGTIQKLESISGHPLLAAAAMEAVQQWRYQTTLLNGQPVEVVTQIDVNFTLSQ